MGLIRIDWQTAPSSVGSYSTTLSAALLSAGLLGPPVTQEEFARILRRVDARWNGPQASDTSFQATAVSYGTTSSTTVALRGAGDELDPWDELKALGPNWDGSGAVPVSREALEHAKKFIHSLGLLGAAFEPFAHPNGSVGLEAHKGGKAAYLIVSPNNNFAYVLRIGDTVHRGKDVTAPSMQQVLDLLF